MFKFIVNAVDCLMGRNEIEHEEFKKRLNLDPKEVAKITAGTIDASQLKAVDYRSEEYQLKWFDEREAAIESLLKDVREARREYINRNNLNKPDLEYALNWPKNDDMLRTGPAERGSCDE